MRILTRSGIAAIGILHIMIGAIALGIATGTSSGEADQSGALHQISAIPGGTVLLWIVLIGMLALCGWQIITALLANNPAPLRRWSFRVVELGKGVGYVVIAATAFTFARGSSTSTAEITRRATVRLLELPGGGIIIVIVGLVVLAVGISFAFSGLTARFSSAIRVPNGAGGVATIVLGILGYTTKGLALCLVGLVFVFAPFTVDRDRLSGMDGALKGLMELPYGDVTLTVIGAGLVAYGVFFILRARLVRL
ncbi:DUF1206 domain-containing protein [Leifsonia kafniensis]|uniref:DUF1206 domain-containing protein n=1 Tax=Leifsonia kafniensis TaxID=475957 RepID=A0ABP7L6L1_9MICO